MDEILERVGRLEADHKTASHETSLLLRELYMMSSVSLSTVNILLSKLMELSIPGGIDKNQSARIADGIMVKLIANAIRELEKCTAFHSMHSDPENLSDLYLATKIKVLKENVAETPESETRHK